MKTHTGPASILLFLFVILAAAAAGAAEVAVFGEQQYIRTTGAPNVYEDTFTALPDGAMLAIFNGSEIREQGKSDRVSSGYVYINDQLIFGPEDFKQQRYVMEVPVTLLELNSIRVELQSIPGSFLSLVLIQDIPPSVDLVAISPDINDAACPDSVDLLVDLRNTGEDAADAGVAVTFYNGNPQDGGLPIGTAMSADMLEPGSVETVSLQWTMPPAGKTTIYIRADDIGNGEGLFEEINEENNLVIFEASVCENLQEPDANSISGEVIDAVTGERLSNAAVNLHVSEDGAPGTIIASFLTNYEGRFIFLNLEPGAYVITGTVYGYAGGERQATLTRNAVLAHQDLVLSPLLEDDDIRIILTWGKDPEDLEAHLTAPNAEGCRHHCFYWNQEIPGANLDLDDRHSYGPETITITDLVSGAYRYYVHNFTNRSNLNNYSLAYYGAEVRVYRAGEAEPLVFKTPPDRYTRGTVWHVFDLDGDTGEIIPVNKFTHQVEPGQIDFPRITSSPGSYPRAYWGTPYTYRITAEDPDDDPLTYTLLQGPEGMRVDPATGLLEWSPLGIPDSKNPVSIKVSDGRCGEDTQSFTLYVTSTPAASLSATPCAAYNENGDVTLTWNTAYAETVLIDQGIGEVAPQGSMTIPSPSYPQVYTLTAFNDAAATIRRVPAAAPSPSISFSAYTIEPTRSATLNWNCGCAAFCEIDQGIGTVRSTGSIQVSPLETTTYTITATNAAGTKSYARTLNVRLPTPPAPPQPPPAPYVNSFSGIPSCDWSPGIPITLSWSTRNATSCEITPGVGQVSCNGSIAVNPDKAGTYTLIARGEGGIHSRNFSFPQIPYTYRRLSVSPAGYVQPGDEVVFSWSPSCADTVTITDLGNVEPVGSRTVTVPDSLPRTYTMTAANEAGSSSYAVTLYYFPPTGTFITDNGVIKAGESAVLRWTSQYADTCTITPDVGEVDCAGGAVTVTPDKPSWYYLKLEGWGGTQTYKLYVNFVPPDVDIQATPETIREGESTTLSWVFSNATSCSIDHGIGEVQLGQTLAVSPTATTTYTITAVGPGGTRTDKVTVNVIPKNPPPAATITVNPGVIWNGEESTLAWSSEYADTITITPDIGSVAASGTVTITPPRDTTYTITAAGAGGTATAQVRITVLQRAPTASLTATPENIEPGETAVLSWTTEHADTVTISPDIGTVAASGSLEVSPAGTTTYTLTAKGPGGTAIDRATVSYPAPAVILTAEPVEINYPGTATLSWSAINADSVTINPDIGTVDPSGTIDVAPLATTTYTITATGPGGSVNQSITVTVNYPRPAATLTIEPDAVNQDDSALLTWIAEYADSCLIDPQIGPVACTGEQTVTPAGTTTYTLTAIGPGGTSSTSATVTVTRPEPAITVTAEPSVIQPGDSTVLSWTSTDADSVVIDHGIGEQPANGQVTVFPAATTTYTLTATGPGGSAADSVTVTVTEPGPIALTVISPAEGQTVTRTDFMVTGTVNHAEGLETGVVVNGVVAQVYNGNFAANHVPFQEGENTITLVATDAAGNTLQKSVNVTVQPQPKQVDLAASLESSLAPMQTDIRMTADFTVTGQTNLSYSGPGPVEYLAISNDTYTVRMTEPGLYIFTGTAKDELNNEYTDTLAILAMDKTVLDALLQSKWEGMKEELSIQKIDAATGYFDPRSRERYTAIYSAIIDILPQIAADMGDIQMIVAKDNYAKYRIHRKEALSGREYTITYFIYFIVDKDGLWRIYEY